MNKRIKIYPDDFDPTAMEDTCSLDVADECGGMRLEEIALHLNLSRERVRQIQDNALRKIMYTTKTSKDD
ncbi:MAG: sigma factor-like helix-turn-helix DNA-binding protein [Candidatus Thorarchaeota archaeon]